MPYILTLTLTLLLFIIASLSFNNNTSQHQQESIKIIEKTIDQWLGNNLRTQVPTNLKGLAQLSQKLNQLSQSTINQINNLQAEIHTCKIQIDNLDIGLKKQTKKESFIISSLQETQKKAEANEILFKQYQIITKGIIEGLIVVDLSRNVTYINPIASEITGYNETEVIDKPLQNLVKFISGEPPDEAEIAIQTYCPISSASQTSQTYAQNKIKMIAKDKKEVFVNLTASHLKEGGSVNLGCILTIHDVTKEQELEKLKFDFVSLAAHELRTPLTTVQGYLSFIQKPETISRLNEEEQGYINKSVASATRLNKLIENLLTVSKIEQGKMAIRTQKTQIEPVIERIFKEFMAVAKNKNLKLTFIQPQNPLPQVMIDTIRIEEVISNLIGNGIKYTDEGEVKVFFAQQDNFVIVSVSDSGQGLSEEQQTHLFTKFYRVESSLTHSSKKGTGLGLYLSKNIIESHGGKIWVESVIGKGSVFSFSVPIA